MRVKWVPVLDDPSKDADKKNPITARYAFWIDDESSRINFNTALGKPSRTDQDPQGFWAEQADQFLSWNRKWDKVWEWDYHEANIKWFEGATLNASYNCLDRHLETRADQVAIIWKGDDPAVDKKISYS